MIRLCELSPARSAELELRYNGPIPREMIEWAYAQDRADERRAAQRLSLNHAPCGNFINHCDNFKNA